MWVNSLWLLTGNLSHMSQGYVESRPGQRLMTKTNAKFVYRLRDEDLQVICFPWKNYTEVFASLASLHRLLNNPCGSRHCQSLWTKIPFMTTLSWWSSTGNMIYGGTVPAWLEESFKQTWCLELIFTSSSSPEHCWVAVEKLNVYCHGVWIVQGCNSALGWHWKHA